VVPSVEHGPVANIKVGGAANYIVGELKIILANKDTLSIAAQSIAQYAEMAEEAAAGTDAFKLALAGRESDAIQLLCHVAAGLRATAD
jgi:hypothetical protein